MSRFFKANKMDLSVIQARPLTKMVGEDEEETALFKRAAEEALVYLESFAWCQRILEKYFCFGVDGVVEIFLFRLDRLTGDGKTVDEWLWLVVGDLPSAYLVTDGARTPSDALKAYCELMRGWVDAVLSESDLAHVYPVKADPIEENALLLANRIKFLDEEIIPMIPGAKNGAIHD